MFQHPILRVDCDEISSVNVCILMFVVTIPWPFAKDFVVPFMPVSLPAYSCDWANCYGNLMQEIQIYLVKQI